VPLSEHCQKKRATAALSCLKVIRNGNNLRLRNRATSGATMAAGSDKERAVRAYILIAAFAALAMFAAAHTAGSADRVVGAASCTVNCPADDAEADNGVGTNLPNDPTNYDVSDD
jgi:hypothetical protein